MRIKRKALTTAELMIALTIIGIIAVLVLPGFIEDYNKKIFTTRLKKTYMQLSAAIDRACSDNGVSYFKDTPYSKFAFGKSDAELFLTYYMNGKLNSSGFASSYSVINGEARDCSLNDKYANAVLSDGQAIAMHCSSADGSGVCNILLDVNGKSEPNTEGRDIFSFVINPKTNSIEDADTSDKCLNGSGTNNGGGCLAKIMEANWQMDY